MKFAIYNAHNERQEVDLGAHTLEEMRAADVPTIGKLIEKKVGPTGDQPSALAQVAAQMGIHGGSKIADVMSGKNYIGPEGSQAATVGGDGSITGRLLLQATLFDAIESQLGKNLGGYAKMLADNAAIRRTINRRLARTLSRLDQSTVMFLRRFSVSSCAIFFSVSSVSSSTADSLVASAS